jgi:excisionase family DNA binding protein
MELLLTVEQAATKLQCHRATIRRQIKAGRLRAVRRGGQYRIPESALYDATEGTTPEEQARLIAEALAVPEKRAAALELLLKAPEEVKKLVITLSG